MLNIENKIAGQKTSAFTLIEISVVITLIALIMGISIVGTNNVLTSKERSSTIDKLEYIDERLQSYLKKYGRVPMPSDITLVDTNVNFGAEDTSGTAVNGLYSGGVPVEALGLSDIYTYDAWSQRIVYVVTDNHTASGTYDDNPGGVAVNNAESPPAALIAAGAYASRASYILISYGENNGGGLHYRTAASLAACPTGTNENENCDGDITFIDTGYTNSDDADNFYDDYVLWRVKTFDAVAPTSVALFSKWAGVILKDSDTNVYTDWGAVWTDVAADWRYTETTYKEILDLQAGNNWKDYLTNGSRVSWGHIMAEEAYDGLNFHNMGSDSYYLAIPAGVTKAKIKLSANFVRGSTYGAASYRRGDNSCELHKGTFADATYRGNSPTTNEVLGQINFAPTRNDDAPVWQANYSEMEVILDKLSAETTELAVYCRGATRGVTVSIKAIECDNGQCLYKE